MSKNAAAPNSRQVSAAAYKWHPLPLRPRLGESQQIKHLGFVEDDSANDQLESPIAEKLLRLRHGFRARESMTHENPFKDCAWRSRRRYQDLGHPMPSVSAA